MVEIDHGAGPERRLLQNWELSTLADLRVGTNIQRRVCFRTPG
jgi:hypothetical protein